MPINVATYAIELMIGCAQSPALLLFPVCESVAENTQLVSGTMSYGTGGVTSCCSLGQRLIPEVLVFDFLAKFQGSSRGVFSPRDGAERCGLQKPHRTAKISPSV